MIYKLYYNMRFQTADHPLLDLLYVSFILQQRSLIEGRLASTELHALIQAARSYIFDEIMYSR